MLSDWLTVLHAHVQSRFHVRLGAFLYGAGLARFAEISPPQKILQHYLQCFILCLYESRASPVRRDPAFAYPRSRLTGLIFLHINSAARAGSRADIVHNINFINERWYITQF